MDVKFSKEQQDAIDKEGNNILVSASAGSGKTLVLVERIINKMKKHRINIDELLIVTFTEASANEMKQRLRTKLNKVLLNEPDQHHLRKQIMLLSNANISTFHAFCNGVIAKFFYLIDVDSKSKIADETELFLIADDVLERLFEDLYNEGDSAFIMLINRFTQTSHDESLKTIVKELYTKLRNVPFKEDYITTILKYYQGIKSLSDFKWTELFLKQVTHLVAKAKANFTSAYDLTASGDSHGYSQLYHHDLDEIAIVEAALQTKNYQKIYEALRFVKFKNFASKCSDDFTDDIKETIKKLRDDGKSIIAKLKESYFAFSEASHVRFLNENKVVIEALLKLVGQFECKFQEAKKERGLIDFNDLEEMALKILSYNNYDNDAVRYYRQLFKEILVDEYQDTNSMQETIIQAISNKKNVFTVGDVKQSIYRFRNAEPEIFQHKYQTFGDDDNPNGILINLNANFRSREDIIDFINYIFVQIMDLEVGEIAYDDLARLKFKQHEYLPLDDVMIDLTVIDDKQVREDNDDQVDKAELEAHVVAQKIRKLIDEEAHVYDHKQKELRPIQYNDIVILSRSVKTQQSIYFDVFKAYQIPILANDSAGYFNSIEVLTVTSLLEIIDNPLQDISLVAVLRSPFFHVNEKELIEITTHSKAQPDNKAKYSNYFYDKVKLYVKSGRNTELRLKLEVFSSHLNRWREAIKNESLSELLFDIYHHTNYYDFIKGEVGGQGRQANLDLLFDRAKQFEDLAANSLFRFVSLIKFLKEHDKDLEQARTVSENENLVRFMSIHKSKGLEFPVVFVVNLNKQFNTMDEKAKLLFDKDLGIAFSYFDLDRRVHYDTLYQTLTRNKMSSKMLAEEMRLLYVAFTRAQERIYLVSTVKDYETLKMKYLNLGKHTEPLLPSGVREVNNYFSLILMALMRHPSVNAECISSDVLGHHPQLTKEVITDLVLQDDREDDKLDVETTASELYVDAFKKRLNFVYPGLQKTTHFAKMSVSDIKRANHSVSEYSYKEHMSTFHKPSFIQDQSPTARGTVYHQFMQHLNYNRDYTDDLIDLLKNQLISQEILIEDDVRLIQNHHILNYLKQPLVKRFKEANEVHHELPFTTLVDAKSVYNDYAHDDQVLIQGVMDLLVECGDTIYLIDFKTDRINNEESSILRITQLYQTQMRYYTYAAKQLYPNKEVKAMLYVFEIDKFITVSN